MNYLRYKIFKNAKLLKQKFTHVTIVRNRLINTTSSNCSERNESSSRFFVTTPIFYVNAAPHLGHLYTATIADAVHRYQKLRGIETSVFSTGTDEHGLKIQQAATNCSVSPAAFCDKNSDQFRSLFDSYGIDYTDFIRTTSDDHVNAVQHFYSKLVDRGHVYKGEYNGWYCVSDESFLTESQVTERKMPDGTFLKVSVESGHPVELNTETNYKFEMSKFKDDLSYWLKQDHLVKPKRFLKDLRSMVDGGLYDLSISRPVERVSWGVPVPGDETQSVYVWVDALVNYLTAVGYPNQTMWPPNLQVLGKDILKFHGIYWPTLLMAVGLEPPKQLLVHSHWTVDGTKMSKSLGNIVCPKQSMETMTTEGVRYALLRQGTPHSDGSWKEKESVMLLNAELADSLGNLVHRCTGKSLNPFQEFPALQPEFIASSQHAKELSVLLGSIKEEVATCYDEYNFYQGIDIIMRAVRSANVMVQEEKPWELKANPGRLGSVIHMALSMGHAAAIMLQPIVPRYSAGLLDVLSVHETARLWRDIDRFPSVSHQPTTLGVRTPPFRKIKL
uniref:Methionine--tRNA ligase, mitochondrial n=1 Tax=Hirondellea gigas TaxID=1518452 RepID=A0A2P2I9Z9_9CRUS